ncbi:MAG: chorismate mutase [Dysgonomonas sp.]
MNTKNTLLCNSLEEVRQNIDKIDNELINLIAERSHYVGQTAHFKNSVSELTAPDRVNEIIEKVRTLAEKKGLSPTLTERIFRTIINAFSDEELSEFSPVYREVKKSYY